MFRKEFIIALFGVMGVLLFVGTGCVDEKITTDPNHKLSFSVDTLSFDTLFATIPSRTAIFKIYNTNKEALNISSISLGGESESYFRYNVDGRIPDASNRLYDLTIRGNDSIFVFVEVTAKGTEELMPVMVLDSMQFLTNGVQSNVKLMAYSLDAIILRSHSISSDTTLTGEKPFLIFNYLHVPENLTLTLQAGVQLYFHAGADFVIDGNLMSIGTKEWPVLMRGDRFDTMADVDQTPYDYLPSQWGSLYLQNPQGDHQLIHTHIRGADLGVLLVGGNRSKPKLTLQNVRIHTMGTYGVYVQNGDVLIENSELSNCGESCLLLLGGSAHVVHSTIANYMPWKSRSGKALTVANYVNSQGYITAFPVERAVFENSIIYGSLFDELLLQADTTQSSMFNVVFSHCLIKSKQLSLPYFHDVVWSNVSNGWGNDTVFVNTTLNKEKGYFNFELSEQSHARGRANRDVASRYPLDFYDKSRLSDGAPDIGAYEY